MTNAVQPLDNVAVLPLTDASEDLGLEVRVSELEAQLAASRAATRSAYSALLEQSMDAVLEDGTPVLSLAFAHDPELRARLERVFLPRVS